MRKIFCLILILGIFMTGFSVTKKEFTIMIYMVGSDLESEGGSATDDIEEIISSESGDYNVYIQTGGTLEWYMEGIEDVQRWSVEDNDLVLLEELGEKDTGETSTFSDFLDYGFENFPANRYVLIFWNHGSGPIYGFGGDEIFEDSMLTLNEINSALFKNEAYFDIIAFDACLMGSVETANSLKEYGKYLIASEELEPAFGWDYTYLLNPIAENRDISTEILSKKIVDGFVKECKSKDEEEITISVIKLEEIDVLIEAIDKFFRVINDRKLTDKELISIIEKRKQAESYGKMVVGESSDLVDIVDFITEFENDADVDQVINSVKKAVLYNEKGDLKRDSNGISIYLPERNTQEMTEEIVQSYMDLDFSTEYKTFIEKYTDYLSTLPTLDDYILNSYVESDDEFFDLIIDPEAFEYISEIYYSVGIVKEWEEGGEFILWLGNEYDYDVDDEFGVVSAEFWYGWEMIGDFPVPMYAMDKNDDYDLYAIPAYLNDKGVNIFVLYDDESEQPKILGARNFADEQTGLFDRGYTTIKEGDVISPLYEYYDYETGESDFITLYDYEVEAPFSIDFLDLPEGTYVYAYCLVDYAGNRYFGDPVEMDVY